MKTADVHEIPAEVASQDLWHELSQALSRHLSELLETQGMKEEEIQQDFDAFRRRRR